jgi:predicted O-methyltransferase YrrM
MDAPLKIALVEENPVRAEILKAGLREAGHRDIALIGEMQRLLQAI